MDLRSRISEFSLADFRPCRRLQRVFRVCSSASSSCLSQKTASSSSVIGLSNWESSGAARLLVTWMHVCVFVRRLELTAGIHIDAFDFSFFFIFLDRGKISWFFRVGAGVISLGFCPDGFPCALLNRSKGVAKSSLLPRIQVVPHGRTAMVLVVSVSTCLERELMTLSCSADFFSKVENIFFTSSNTTVFALALTAVTFIA